MLHWWGDEVPADTLAQQRAALIEQGHALQTGTPSRWLRADLVVDGPTLVVRLNSRERLSMLLELLRSVGDTPVVVSESRVDPVADRAWPPALGGLPSGQSPAASGLSPLWLDTPLPALGRRTPRVAAVGEGVVELEQLLRGWEFTGAVDTGWIRTKLEMPID